MAGRMGEPMSPVTRGVLLVATLALVILLFTSGRELFTVKVNTENPPDLTIDNPSLFHAGEYDEFSWSLIHEGRLPYHKVIMGFEFYDEDGILIDALELEQKHVKGGVVEAFERKLDIPPQRKSYKLVRLTGVRKK